MRQLLRWAALSGIACALAGCGSLHLYSATADATATRAKADYDASKIKDSIKLSRGVLDGLDSKEIEAFRSLNLAERNATLLSLLSDSGNSEDRTVAKGFVTRFNAWVDERLLLLTGGTRDADRISTELATATAAVNDAAGREKRARAALSAFDPAFAFLPACDAKVAALKDVQDLVITAELLKNPDLKPKHPGLIPNWTQQIRAVGSQCSNLITARAQLVKTRTELGGQLGLAAGNTQTQATLFAKSRNTSSVAAAQLKVAAKELADAQKGWSDNEEVEKLTCDFSTKEEPAAAGTVSDKDAVGKKKELCKLLAKLRGLDDFGVKVLTEERLTKINAILGALGGEPGAGNQGELETGLALISTSSQFAQVLTRYQKAKKLPPVEPLLIDKGITTAQLNYAQAGVQLAESRVQYAQDYEAATQLEVLLLARAKAEIAALKPPPAAETKCGEKLTVFCASVSDLMDQKKLAKEAGGGGESANRRVYRALALVSESYSVARDRQVEAALRMIDTEYRVGLSRSEASLASWDALLSVPVNQLKEYHLGGTKVSDVATLAVQAVQALAAVGIAVRIP